MKSTLKALVGGSISAIEIFASWADRPRCIWRERWQSFYSQGVIMTFARACPSST